MQAGVQQPLLPQQSAVAVLQQQKDPATMQQLWRRVGVRRAVAAAALLAGAGLLTLAFPTNKALPCPWCKLSSYIGWVYFVAWSFR
jgi:hypothetical protein